MEGSELLEQLFFHFFETPVITSAVLLTSTNQINCVYEDSALSVRERTLRKR